MPRPAGCSPGAPAALIGWVGMVLVTVVMGSSAGVMVAVPAGLGLLWSAFAGLIALRGVAVESLQVDDTVAGQPAQVRVRLRHRAPVGVQIESLAGHGWVTDGAAAWEAIALRRGRFDAVDVTVRSGGRPALLWWTRTLSVPTGGWSVSAAPQLPGAPLGDPAHHGDDAVREGASDQLRQWTDGDLLSRVHWPSSSRSTTMIVRQPDHQRRHAVVLVAADTTDGDTEAGRVVSTAERLLRDGATVTLRSGSADVLIAHSAELRDWSAAFAPRPPAVASTTPWYRRYLHVTTVDTPGAPGVPAHLLTAITRAAACWFLLRGLAVGTVGSTIAAAGALATTLPLVHLRSRGTRTSIGGAAAVAVLVTSIEPELVAQPHQVWRAALPQLLVALVVLHGYDASDRRGLRVGTAFAALVATYAAAIRVDGDLLTWCVSIGVLVAAAISQIGAGSRPTRRRPPWQLATGAAPLLAVVAASLALLSVIPVPGGPNRLFLPTFVAEGAAQPRPGQLVDPSGNTPAPSNGASPSAPTRVGGYPGFADAMDTSWRGDLGDDVVLRVRSPYPDFWRGQTFGEFDGRSWTPVGGDGWQMQGPYIDLDPVFGDRFERGEDTFTQTFTAEVDLGNLLFAAGQAEQLVFDGDVWRRPDGALRADSTLPAGTVYTVISSRSGADASVLRADGVIDYASPDLVEVFGPYVRVPGTTSERTLQLARSLANGTTSTYDTVRAIERWLGQHVTYTLDAPVPPAGADGVDHFLFESRQGFCEQISSALAVMLRSLGVPARIATGYVPGERDAVSGTWISRARDAHAWVEVYFPSVGWQPFDPTASVPLQGDSSRPAVGDGLWSDVSSQLSRATVPLLSIVTAVVVAAGAVRGFRRLRRWRQRGRWGRLQDRFTAAAVARGAPAGSPNPTLADHLAEPARAAASALDAAAFDPHWRDDPAAFERAAGLVDAVSPRR